MVGDLERLQLKDWVRNETGEFRRVKYLSLPGGLVVGLSEDSSDEVKYYTTDNKEFLDAGAQYLSKIKLAGIGKKILGRFDWPVYDEDQDEICYEIPGLDRAYIWTDGCYSVYNKLRDTMDEGSCAYLHEFQHVLSDHGMPFDFIPSRNPMFIEKSEKR